jgi:cytoskeleton protein RodZ
MNETKTSDITAENLSIEAIYQAIGSLLQQTRIKAGLSQADMAEKIKLSTRQIDALEQGHYEALPGHVFIRGFVRSYARVLGMDIAPLLAKLDEVAPDTRSYPRLPDLHEEKITIHGGYHRKRRMQRLLLTVVILLILIIIGGMGMRYLIRDNIKADSAEIELSSAPLTSNEAISANASLVAQSSSDTTASTSSQASESTSIQTGPGVVVAPLDASVTPAANTLQIRAAQDTWVQVVDGNNDTLFYGIVKADTIQNLGGQVPYRVHVGNAHYTTLIYDGKVIDLAPFTHGNVARVDVK